MPKNILKKVIGSISICIVIMAVIGGVMINFN